MTFYIYIRSGLNNKLIPLIGLLRIAKKENRKIKCFWGEDAYISKSIFSFLDLFEPIENLTFISYNEYMNAFNNRNYIIYNRAGSDRNSKETIYKSDKNIAVFNKIVHLISYNEDNVVGNYIPYPCEKRILTPIIKELKEIIKELKPNKLIMNKINETTDKFKKQYVVGLHLRTTDGGFTDIPYKDVYGVIENYIKSNNDIKIYISCDNISLEKYIISKYSDNILFFKNPFGKSYGDKFNRMSYGTINAVCEMFILSKCNKFLGTPSSSFSFMVWLLRKDELLDFWCKNPW